MSPKVEQEIEMLQSVHPSMSTSVCVNNVSHPVKQAVHSKTAR